MIGDLVSWRKEISIIETRNSNEIEYLRLLNIANIGRENMLEIITTIHMSGKNNLDFDLIWKDLEFVKKNFDICNPKDILSLFVPVQNGFLPLKYAKIPTLLCFKLSLMINDEKIINLPGKNLSNYEILEWEYFFIKLGIDIPQSTALEIKDMLLQPLSDFDERETNLALKILNLNENIIDFIKLLPIKCSDNLCSIPHQTIHLNCFEIPNSHFIRIPDYAKKLAEKLGVITRPNSSLCISALETLVLENNKFKDEYIKWFTKLNESLSEESFVESHFQSKKIICLTNFNQENDFYSPNQVFVNPKSPITDILSKYKIVINKNNNKEFLGFENLLKKLGFKIEPDINDLVELINIMSQDSKNFCNQNFLANLTYCGISSLKSVYFQLENLLQQKANFNQPITWQIRQSLKTTIENSLIEYLDELTSLPLLTIDKKLIMNKNLKEKILVTSLNKQINKLFQIENLTTHYVSDCEIGINCPFIMSIIGCTYLEPNCLIKLTHQTNNMEVVYPLINQMLKTQTGLTNLQILNVVYIGAHLVYDPFLAQIRKKDTYSEKSLKTLSLHSFDYILLDNNTLMCSTKFSNKSEFLSVYEKGLGELLSRRFPLEEVEYKLNNCMKILDNQLKELRLKTENWSYGSTEDSFFNMDQVSLQVVNNKSNSHKLFSKPKNTIEQSMYQNRIFQILDSLPKLNNLDFMSVLDQHKCHLLNETTIEIGKRARLFFYNFLEIVYPGSFEWITFSKNSLYNDNFVAHDGGLGYDFIIYYDHQKIFTYNGKKCLIEVKGFGGEWKGNFFVNKNQQNSYDQTKQKDDIDYVFVIIDNLNDIEKSARISKILNWTENPNILNLETEVFRAIVNQTTNKSSKQT